MKRSFDRLPLHPLYLVLFCILLTTQNRVEADEIYRWEGPDGVVHYTNEPPDDYTQPADLPRITRGRLGLTSPTIETCDKHGGINCQVGADFDGSVICLDGFKDTPTRYRFHCNSPKLEVADIGVANERGEFTILIRNSRSVAADKPELLLRLNESPTGIVIRGPEKIEPYEVAEFFYKPEEYGALSNELRREQITLSCQNCEN